MRRRDQPSRPNAITCCFLSSLKTLLTLSQGIPCDRFNVLSQPSLAGFQVITYGRVWVFTEGVHTNGLENFWSLLKRGLNGTYVSVEPFHLFRYLDEQTFRYNNRGKEMNDFDRFELALSQITGKRLTYEHLTGKDREPDTALI